MDPRLHLRTTPSSPLRGSGAPKSEITGRILETVRSSRVCEMEELVQACSSYTWNQVFLEVDRLSRTGELRLLPKRAGVYTVTLPAA
ncbi:MAG TPA: hypothetical protein VJ746_08390 [Nitrospira sp.]|nr:hypothetical protein [Nitrospira sp.]